MKFTRPTLVAATELLEGHTQADFDQMIIRLNLENHITESTKVSVKKKCALLARILVNNPNFSIETFDGSMTLGEAVVREALTFMRPPLAHYHKNLRTDFKRGLARDGYVISFDQDEDRPILLSALPADSELELPEADDEIRKLLKEKNFTISLGHLDQAVKAHTRGDWAAANSQIRTFIESLFDGIAHSISPEEAQKRQTSESRRALLEKLDFLSSARNEWTSDGKNYINGLFKMLHKEGPHPGLSDEEHSTFRLHVALVTARTFLRRLRYDWSG